MPICSRLFASKWSKPIQLMKLYMVIIFILSFMQMLQNALLASGSLISGLEFPRVIVSLILASYIAASMAHATRRDFGEFSRATAGPREDRDFKNVDSHYG